MTVLWSQLWRAFSGMGCAVGKGLRNFQLKKVCFLGSATLVGCYGGKGPDMIFFGGPVLTVNFRDDVVHAIAIKDGRITAVGNVDEILALREPRTVVRDLQGKVLLPGFIAAHEHPTLSAVFGDLTDLSGFKNKTNEQVWDALRNAVGGARIGSWIFASGLDPILVPDLVIPTRQTLDAIAPNNPVVVISQTAHSFWANSKAFDAAGITRFTPDPG